MVHVPVLRGGRSYRSLQTLRLMHVATGEPVAEVSQANAGLIARDLADSATARRALERLTVAALIEICRKAGRVFAEEALPLDANGATQTAEDYLAQLSATTGLPLTLCRANRDKLRSVLEGMEAILGGLTRGLDPEVLDGGWVEQEGRLVSYRRETDLLGAVLPGNSPGVHGLWLPAIALKTPLALKPGGREPWTPFRLAQALIAAGCPAEAFGVYPTDHGGAAQILLASGRSMLFGDASTVGPWRDDPRVQLHGPGWSKVILGPDAAARFEQHVAWIADSVAQNGGRSCLNASGVWLPSRGRELAEAMAKHLAAIDARPLDDPEAALAAFSDPGMARRISAMIDRQLAIPGAVDLSAAVRGKDRVVEAGGCTFLRPTVVFCSDPAHPLAAAEFLFPFVSVVEVPESDLPERIGPTLVGTVVTEDEALAGRLFDSPWIDRLNLGPIPTYRISWDQPHEGNLFEHLYRQRALQRAPAIAG